MKQPLVACVLLTADRPEMTKRAVACFEKQTHRNRVLIVWDTGARPITWEGFPPPGVWQCERPLNEGKSIGQLRNDAAAWCLRGPTPHPDFFAHWDSDDWSHPYRLEEQVALIESDPTVDAVGYSDMLFWDSTVRDVKDYEAFLNGGTAWLYTSTSSYLLGTSLLYRRAAWERRPFEPVSQGEDRRWLAGVWSVGVCSLMEAAGVLPRMIASVHGANTSSFIDPHSENFRRVPEWDQYCRATMALPAMVAG